MENTINNSQDNQKGHTNNNNTFTNVYRVPKFGTVNCKIVATPWHNTPIYTCVDRLFYC